MTNGRRARNTVLIGIAGFVLLQAGLAVVLMLFPHWREGDYGVKAARLQQRLRSSAGRPCTVVMLGSSRTAFGLRGLLGETQLSVRLGRPIVLSNFGLWGAGPVTHLLNTRRLLADGLRPDLLLVEVLPAMLAGQTPSSELDESVLPVTSLRKEELAVIARFAGDLRKKSDLKRDWRLSWATPWYSQRFTLLSRAAPFLLSYKDRVNGFANADDSGWMQPAYPPRTPTERAERQQAAKKEYAGRLADFELGGPGVAALRELLDLCRHERLPVVLVLMPEGPAFRSWYAPHAFAQVERFLRGLGAEFGVSLLNAREWIPEELFVDSHHLLADGAAVFTKRLVESLVPFWADGATVAAQRRPLHE